MLAGSQSAANIGTSIYAGVVRKGRYRRNISSTMPDKTSKAIIEKTSEPTAEAAVVIAVMMTYMSIQFLFPMEADKSVEAENKIVANMQEALGTTVEMELRRDPWGSARAKHYGILRPEAIRQQGNK